MPSDDLLTVTGLTQQFGGVKAVDNCDYVLQKGRLAAVIGPNGAGKSTLVNLIAGALPLQQGSVRLDGVEIGGWPAYKIAQHGVIRTFQVARGFDKLTVLENMMVAPLDQPGESLFNAVVRPGRGKAAEVKQVARALEFLNMFELYRLRNEYAGELSGGQRRLLELARALMGGPKLLLLDEPMAAISPVLVERIGQHLLQMQRLGITMLLVEHNLGVVEKFCDWVTVMVEGRAVVSGTMAQVREHPEVISAYLGREVVSATG
ncbi:MAG: branched-chain amino acid transport system ATP-binding protein [Chloroflexota bacterium]|jgi:ABC-type branched-subunit amino acid transport system ATPase component|nr:branched-chain amino acid transport system ATP-binding protein [Chloroflexota bacterium]